MKFSEEQIKNFNGYVTDNHRERTVKVTDECVTLHVWQFVATIKPGNPGFVLTVSNEEASPRDLGFTYGLPFTVNLDNSWDDRELLSYLRSLLNDLIVAMERLHSAIASIREMKCACYELNRSYNQLGADAINVATSLNAAFTQVIGKPPSS